VSLFPPHEVYDEPFLGAGSVLLNKTPAPVEVAGDVNSNLITTFITLRDCPTSVIEALRNTPYTRDAFVAAFYRISRDLYNCPIERTVDFIVKNRMSRGGLGKTFAWSDRLRGGKPGDLNAWQTIQDELHAIAERVRNVTFGCVPAAKLITEYDSPETLHYLDPPYLHETRTARKAYEHEMTREDHVALLEKVLRCRGHVFISGYRSDLYDTLLAGWRRREWELPNHSGQGVKKQRRVECLWSNT